MSVGQYGAAKQMLEDAIRMALSSNNTLEITGNLFYT